MSGFSTSASVGAAARAFLSLLRPALADAPVGDRGGEHGDVGRQRRLDRRAASRARSRPRRCCTPGGSGTLTGPRHQRHRRRRPPPARARDRVTLLAGRAVGDVAHRIDRLVGRPRGDQHALARAAASGGRGSRSSASIAATISGGSAMRPTPASPLSAISPAFGPTKRDAVGAQRRAGCAGSPGAPTSAGSWPARSAPACRSRAAPSRRDRRRGPAPSCAIRSAVAGATTTRSQSRARRMWPTFELLRLVE